MSNSLEQKNSRKGIIIGLVILVLIILSSLVIFKIKSNKDNSNSDNNNTHEEEVKKENKYSKYELNSNTLEDFDLYFLQLENDKSNKVYSPLSIKYVLGMLSDASLDDTKQEIDNILGKYQARKYTNTSNMALGNAMFIRNSYQDKIKSSYVNTLKSKYNAEVIYDEFKNTKTINNWLNKSTNGLIKEISDEVSDKDFILVNSVAIDMEWIKKLQSIDDDYSITYSHEDYWKGIGSLRSSDYTKLKFNNYKDVTASEIGAVINKYDIVKTLGSDNIRKRVMDDYNKWVQNGGSDTFEMCGTKDDLSDEDKLDIDKYLEELDSNYKDISGSTDFSFYQDENVTAFSKDLKKYNGITLEYVGIMPNQVSLDEYIKETDASKINSILNNLKDISLENFKEGVITEISGYIPMFKFDYKLNLKKDLSTIGITSVFDSNKASLGNLTTDKVYINDVSHQANIEFSNDGIKASAATVAGGAGAGSCGYDYQFNVPVEKIDLTFDKPYMFMIRNKDTKEVWFMGTVYEPSSYASGLKELE